MAMNVTMADWGFLDGQRYLLMDRDTKLCAAFRRILRDAGVKPVRLPPGKRRDDHGRENGRVTRIMPRILKGMCPIKLFDPTEGQAAFRMTATLAVIANKSAANVIAGNVA